MYAFFNIMMEPICDYCFHLEISKHLFTESQEEIAVKTTNSLQAEGGSKQDQFVQISNSDVLSFILWKLIGVGSKPARTNRLYEKAKEYLD
tara:strand:+ start:442 stop:714 length:273 start_codon:yes stop_codon:yes gene_type:complete